MKMIVQMRTNPGRLHDEEEEESEVLHAKSLGNAHNRNAKSSVKFELNKEAATRDGENGVDIDVEVQKKMDFAADSIENQPPFSESYNNEAQTIEGVSESPVIVMQEPNSEETEVIVQEKEIIQEEDAEDEEENEENNRENEENNEENEEENEEENTKTNKKEEKEKEGSSMSHVLAIWTIIVIYVLQI
eukprot:GHVL01040806.1.p1 GENE.GHVL01040806.1~~GHVL01040806.1.p1  ORF type:complete len:189 (+),score=69.05 GHVL01040806.1:69-635(+)